MDLVIVILLVFLLISVFLLLFLFFKKGSEKENREQLIILQEQLKSADSDKNRIIEEKENIQKESRNLSELLQKKDDKIASLEKELAVVKNELENEIEQSSEKIKLISEAREELANQFKVLANNILDEKSKTFKEQNKSSIGEILEPLKEKLGEFQKKIQDNYETEGKERHSLANEVKKLMELNQKLSQEASNLTNALKGDNKTQGNWGEMILERILEVSGLRKGEEYSTQESHTRADGSRVQPDVVIHLPEDRHMIIDSKVSLNAYDDYVNEEDEALKSDALKQHINSVRTHMKGLASKEYQKLYGDKSPDFVIMFIPIESAFMLAIAEDNKLWEDAWKSNILLVSSSTLLFVMRIVMQLWRTEHRSRNALDISKKGAAIYDKLVGFVKDFEDIGIRLMQAQKSFDSAKGKFSSGRGNIIRQAEQLKELGVTSSKKLPEEYIENSNEELKELPPIELEEVTDESILDV